MQPPREQRGSKLMQLITQVSARSTNTTLSYVHEKLADLRRPSPSPSILKRLAYQVLLKKNMLRIKNVCICSCIPFFQVDLE